MAKPTLSIFAGNKNLGIIFSEQNQITTKYLEGNIPFTSTSGRASFRLNATRFIMLQGSHDGTGFDGATPDDRIGDFIFEIEDWFNTFSTSYAAATYTDSYGTSYLVDCVDWTWTKSFDNPFRIIWSLILVQK